jgi:hypothetical protein
VSPESIPHYYRDHWKDGENISQIVQRETNEYLYAVGYKVQFIEFPLECNLAQLRDYLSHYLKDMYVIIGCNSIHGGHSVIMKNHNYMWDPSIDGSGCVGPMDDGYYWIGLLVGNPKDVGAKVN